MRQQLIIQVSFWGAFGNIYFRATRQCGEFPTSFNFELNTTDTGLVSGIGLKSLDIFRHVPGGYGPYGRLPADYLYTAIQHDKILWLNQDSYSLADYERPRCKETRTDNGKIFEQKFICKLERVPKFPLKIETRFQFDRETKRVTYSGENTSLNPNGTLHVEHFGYSAFNCEKNVL